MVQLQIGLPPSKFQRGEKQCKIIFDIFNSMLNFSEDVLDKNSKEGQ